MFEIKKDSRFTISEQLLYNISEELKELKKTINKENKVEEIKEIPRINKKPKRKG
jgi:hypothetical protein